MLIPIYGAIGIQVYGTALCIGLLTTIWLISRNPSVLAYPGLDHIMAIIGGATYAGLIGARLLNYLTEYDAYASPVAILFFWKAGYDSWGAIIGVVLYIIGYSLWYRLTLGVLLDIAGYYAPLIHSIARIGCFMHGCCGGIYSSFWAKSGLGITHHPTQLYSSALFLLIFILQLRRARSATASPAGDAFLIYLCGMSIERYMIDFLRDDRLFLTSVSTISIPQLFALAGILLTSVTWYYRSRTAAQTHEYI